MILRSLVRLIHVSYFLICFFPHCLSFLVVSVVIINFMVHSCTDRMDTDSIYLFITQSGIIEARELTNEMPLTHHRYFLSIDCSVVKN